MKQLTGTKKAVLRIERVLKHQEKIVIFADDDTDGVISAVMMFEILKKLGLENLKIHLAKRAAKGKIGLTKKDILKFKSKNIGLIITLDCGTNDKTGIVLAKRLGMDTIVIDHHRINSGIPPAFAFINPQQLPGKLFIKNLSTAGLVYKLAVSLSKYFKKDINISSFFDLIAISTIFDFQKIKKENKIFIEEGKKTLKHANRIGLRILAKDNPDLKILGQKLNVDPAMSLKLLFSKDKETAQKLVMKINEKFHSKQKLVQKIFKSAQRMVDSLNPEKFIFIGDKNWPLDILGDISSLLRGKYQKPVFVYTKAGKYYIGSARAPQNYNLVEIMKKCRHLLINFGGHAQAAGFTIKPANLNKFIIHLDKILK